MIEVICYKCDKKIDFLKSHLHNPTYFYRTHDHLKEKFEISTSRDKKTLIVYGDKGSHCQGNVVCEACDTFVSLYEKERS